MAFRFRLERVLDHRRRQEDLCGRELAAAQRVVATLDRSIAEHRTEQARAAAGVAGALDVGRRRDCALWIQHLDHCLDRLRAERVEAVVAVDAGRQKLQAAWRDREVLERLRARRREEWLRVRDRRETRELDEVGLVRSWRRRQGIAD